MNIPKIRFKEFSTVWNQGKVEEYYKLIPTNSFSRNDLNYTSGSVKNIHYGDIHVKFTSHLNSENEVLPFISDTVNFRRYSTDSMCVEGDIILADASEDVKDIGKSIEITSVNNEKILSGLHTIHLRPIADSFAVGFSGYLFRTSNIVKQIQKESQGAKVLGISGKKVLKIELLFPLKPEQQKIADFLMVADKKISFLKEKKELLEKYKTGVTKKIFSQELRFKDERGHDFPVWKNKTLREISLKVQSGGTPTSTRKDYYCGLIPFLSISDMTRQGKYLFNTTNHISEKGLNNSSSWVVPAESIIYSMYASVGFVSINKIPLATSQAVLNIILKEKYSKEYIYYYLCSIKESLSKFITKGTQGNLNAATINQFVIPIPNICEQNKIANLLSKLDLKINFTEEKIIKTELWKKGLLQQMFA